MRTIKNFFKGKNLSDHQKISVIMPEQFGTVKEVSVQGQACLWTLKTGRLKEATLVRVLLNQYFLIEEKTLFTKKAMVLRFSEVQSILLIHS